jgi:hypothetical protein
MIVFDLLCSSGHRFEGWFASSDDHEAQAARGLIACPLCDDRVVTRAVTAAAVPAKSNQRSATIVDPATKLLAMQRALEADSTWVGDRFAVEARALHASGATGSIHGSASLDDARALIEDGVPLLPLPFRPKAIADA